MIQILDKHSFFLLSLKAVDLTSQRFMTMTHPFQGFKVIVMALDKVTLIFSTGDCVCAWFLFSVYLVRSKLTWARTMNETGLLCHHDNKGKIHTNPFSLPLSMAISLNSTSVALVTFRKSSQHKLAWLRKHNYFMKIFKEMAQEMQCLCLI